MDHVFQRDANGQYTPAVEPAAEWVIKDKAQATRKWVGLGAWYRDGEWFLAQGDGWVPAAEHGRGEALDKAVARGGRMFTEGTYELVGPEIADNAERYQLYTLVPHGVHVLEVQEYTYDGLRRLLDVNPWLGGLVFYREPYQAASGMAKVDRDCFRELSPAQREA